MERLDLLVAASWQGAILGLLVFGVCRFFPRVPARDRALLWWAVSLKMAVVVLGAFALPLPLLPAPKAESSVGVFDLPPAPIVGSAALPPASSAAPAVATIPPPIDPAAAIVGLWALGAVALVVSIVVQSVRLAGMIRRASPLPQGPLAEEARRLGVAVGVARRPEVLLSDEVTTPMVVRPWRPVIVFPMPLVQGMDEQDARMALAHELAHLRRGDLWLAVVPALAQALLWFHPVAWLAAREWATEREAACDAEAIAATGSSPADYGRLLMKIVSNDHRRSFSPVLGATAAYHTLKRRIETMRSFAPRPSRALRFGGGAFAVATLLAALPWQVTAQTPDAAPKTPEKNLVKNSGFENGLQEWQMMQSNANRPVAIDMAIDTSERHSGKASLRFSKTEVSFFPIRVLNQELPLSSATRRLKVGMWVKAQQARKATMAVITDDHIEWGAYVGEAKDGDKPANHDWRFYTATVNVPANTKFLAIGLQMYGPGTVWLDDVTASFMPNDTPLKKAVDMDSDEDPLADVKDVPNEGRSAGNDPLKRYFLIGKPAAGPSKLLVVIPGGDGGEAFNPWVRRIWKNALPPGYLVAQVIAPQWSEDQKQALVWPTKKVRWTGMKFSTEELIEAVVKDVAAKTSLDPSKTFLLAWSSGGPAAYATALSSPTIKGAFVAMSVYKPENLPAPSGGRGRPFYLLQSPDDRLTPFVQAETAQRELKAGGAIVTLATYKGGHGWLDDPYGNIRKGIEWLEVNAK